MSSQNQQKDRENCQKQLFEMAQMQRFRQVKGMQQMVVGTQLRLLVMQMFPLQVVMVLLMVPSEQVHLQGCLDLPQG